MAAKRRITLVVRGQRKLLILMGRVVEVAEVLEEAKAVREVRVKDSIVWRILDRAAVKALKTTHLQTAKLFVRSKVQCRNPYKFRNPALFRI